MKHSLECWAYWRHFYKCQPPSVEEIVYAYKVPREICIANWMPKMVKAWWSNKYLIFKPSYTWRVVKKLASSPKREQNTDLKKPYNLNPLLYIKYKQFQVQHRVVYTSRLEILENWTCKLTKVSCIVYRANYSFESQDTSWMTSTNSSLHNSFCTNVPSEVKHYKARPVTGKIWKKKRRIDTSVHKLLLSGCSNLVDKGANNHARILTYI